MITRRSVLKSAMAAGAAIALPTAFSQGTGWPASTVRLVVPFSVGGASDVLTRLLSERLTAKLGQSFIVDNRTGAGGNIGMTVVRNAPADGYTIASATVGTMAINQFLFAKMEYDPAKDFAPVSTIWENCNVFVVEAKHPAKTVQEFLVWAKKRPKGVTYGSAGIGTTPHLAGEMFRARSGLDAIHVPYRGASQSMPALLSGDTDFAIDNIASYMSLIRAGKVRALAVTSPERWPTLPAIPTMAEAGVKDFTVTSWGMFVLPKATPVAIIDKLSAALQAISKEPGVQERFLSAGARSVSSTPQEAMAIAERERIKWKAVVLASGARLD